MNGYPALVGSCINLFEFEVASELTEDCHPLTDGNWVYKKMILIDQVMFD